MFIQDKIEEFGEDTYGKIFKYCFFLKDPLSYFNKSGYKEKERLDELNHNLKYTFKAKEHRDTFEWLSTYNMTRLERSLEDMFVDLKGYDIMMQDWEWTPGNDSRDPLAATKKIATATAYKKFYSDILEVQKEIKSEASDSGVGRAGYEKSQVERLAEKHRK